MELLQRIASANGWFFGPVFVVLSVAGVTIGFWRLWRYWNVYANVDDFVSRLTESLSIGGPQAALETCEDEPGVIAEVFKTALETSHRGKVAVRTAIARSIETDLRPRLNFLLSGMSFIIKIAPMLGLLGTVWGMIGAFGEIAGQTKVDPQSLADDIGMALFTTAEGLAIAIMVMGFQALCRWYLGGFEKDLRRSAEIAVDLLPEMQKSRLRPQSVPPPVPPAGR